MSIETENGGITSWGGWSQNRYEVIFSFNLPSDVRAADINFGVAKKTLCIVIKGCTYFRGELKYDTDIKDDEDLLWEVKTCTDGARILVTHLSKKSPIAGSFIWWKNAFVNDPEVDITSIKGRSGLLSESTEWDIAHEMFRKRVAEIQPTYIDPDEAFEEIQST